MEQVGPTMGEGDTECVQYNHMMMAFLKAQLDKVQGLEQELLGASEEDLRHFANETAKGWRLLWKHKQPFDIRDCYHVGDARKGVEEICCALKRILGRCQAPIGLEIRDRIPEQCVEEDKQYMHSFLNYLLRGECSSVDDMQLQRWAHAKCLHQQKLEFLKIISENVLKLERVRGEGAWGSVHEAWWPEGRVAVKKPLGGASIEEHARIMKEAAVQASLDNSNIVKLLAVTESGWLVMELADGDLMALRRKDGFKWSMKHRSLQHAAAGLHHLHSLKQPLVHSDIKTSNFLVFGAQTDEFVVKIGDFGLTFEQRADRSKTVRRGEGSPQYLAPEYYNNEPLTAASDIFSLGVVMHEVVTGEDPYVTVLGQINPMVIMYKKLTGDKPCSVRTEDCPLELQKLMEECCAVDPKERPTMEVVCQRLQQLPSGWDPYTQLPCNLEPVLPTHNREDASAQETGCTRYRALKVPVALRAEAKLDNVDFQELWVSQPLKRFFQARLTALVRWLAEFLGQTAVVLVENPQEGCVIFPLQIEFPDARSADLFERQLVHCGASIFQADLELLPYKPRSLKATSEECSRIDVQIPELLQQLQSTAKEIGEVPCVLYSCNMLTMLQSKITPLAQIPTGMPFGASPELWKEDLTTLLHNLRLALQLLKLHRSLDITSVYSSGDDKLVVDGVLQTVKSFVTKYDLPIDVSVPSDMVDDALLQDRDCLTEYLRYVIEKKPCSFQDVPILVKEGWEALKHEIAEKRGDRVVIPVHAVRLVRMIGDSVFEAVWEGKPVACKQVISVDMYELSAEEFSTFYLKTCCQRIPDPQHVVKTLGATKSGVLVMELAKHNMMQWYQALQSTDDKTAVGLKIKLLAQAARALLSLHAQGVVHGNVKSTNFLIFSEGLGEFVKIAELTPVFEQWDTTVGLSKSAPWMAGELYGGQAPNLQTDVFAFGATMYEVLMGEVPYGKDTTAANVLKAKIAGEEPFVIPGCLQKELPEELLEIMKRCCLPNPDDRPEMEALSTCLHNASWSWLRRREPNMPSIGKDVLDLIVAMEKHPKRQNPQKCHRLLDSIQKLEPLIWSAMEQLLQPSPLVLASFCRLAVALTEASKLVARAGSMGSLAAFVQADAVKDEFVSISTWLADTIADIPLKELGFQDSEGFVQFDAGVAIDVLLEQLRTIEYDLELGDEKLRRYREMHSILDEMSAQETSPEEGTALLSELLGDVFGKNKIKEELLTFFVEIANAIFRTRTRPLGFLDTHLDEISLGRVQQAVIELMNPNPPCAPQQKREIPAELLCPLTHRLMHSPTMLVETGATYDSEAIENWLAQGNRTCPATGQSLSSTKTVINIAVKRIVEDWKEKNPGNAVPASQAHNRGQQTPEPAGPPGHSRTNLKLNHLASWVSEAALKSLFQKYGTVTSCTVWPPNHPSSHKFGFVEFATTEQAEAAIAGMNGYLMGDLKLKVKFAKIGERGHPQAQRHVWDTDSAHRCRGERETLPGEMPPALALLTKPKRNLYVNHLPHWVDEAQLRSLFQEHGTVTTCRLMSQQPGVGTKYGFVEFATVAQAMAAIDRLNGYSMGDQKLAVRTAKPKREAPPSEPPPSEPPPSEPPLQRAHTGGTKLYISGFPSQWSEKDLETVFKKAGYVQDCRVVRQNNKGGGAYGFVTMESAEDAKLAIEVWHNNTPKDCTRPLTVVYSHTPGSRG